MFAYTFDRFRKEGRNDFDIDVSLESVYGLLVCNET